MTATSPDDSLTLVVGCVQDQQHTVRETLPSLMSAAVYADKLIIVTREADTLLELPGFSETASHFSGFMD